MSLFIRLTLQYSESLWQHPTHRHKKKKLTTHDYKIKMLLATTNTHTLTTVSKSPATRVPSDRDQPLWGASENLGRYVPGTHFLFCIFFFRVCLHTMDMLQNIVGASPIHYHASVRPILFWGSIQGEFCAPPNDRLLIKKITRIVSERRPMGQAS